MHPDHVPFYAQRNQSRVTNAHVDGMQMAAIGANPLPDYVLPKRSATFEEMTHDRVQTVIRNQTAIASLRDAQKAESGKQKAATAPAPAAEPAKTQIPANPGIIRKAYEAAKDAFLNLIRRKS